MPTIHSIVLANCGDCFQIGVVLEEHAIRTKEGETSSFLCALYPEPLQGRPVESLQAKFPDEALKTIDRGYQYGTEAFLLQSPAYAWAQSYVAQLDAPPAPDAAATSAQGAATPAS